MAQRFEIHPLLPFSRCPILTPDKVLVNGKSKCKTALSLLQPDLRTKLKIVYYHSVAKVKLGYFKVWRNFNIFNFPVSKSCLLFWFVGETVNSLIMYKSNAINNIFNAHLGL